MVRKRTFVQLYYKAMWFQNKIEMVRKRAFVQLYYKAMWFRYHFYHTINTHCPRANHGSRAMALRLLIEHSFERFNQVASLLVHVGEVLLREVVVKTIASFIVKLQQSRGFPHHFIL